MKLSEALTVDDAAKCIKTCSCGGSGYVRIHVPVGHPLFGKAIPCVCTRDAAARERAERLRKASGISPGEWERFQLSLWEPRGVSPMPGETKEQAVKRAKETLHICQEFARNPDGWLILVGPPGVGKTHLAYGIAISALSHGYAVHCHLVPSLLNMLRNAYSSGTHQELFDDLQRVTLLILDDLGAERPTEWSNETILQLLDRRLILELPTVLTTNVPQDEWGNIFGLRLASRLSCGTSTQNQEGLVRIIPCAWGDFRPKAPKRLGSGINKVFTSQ